MKTFLVHVLLVWCTVEDLSILFSCLCPPCSHQGELWLWRQNSGNRTVISMGSVNRLTVFIGDFLGFLATWRGCLEKPDLPLQGSIQLHHSQEMKIWASLFTGVRIQLGRPSRVLHMRRHLRKTMAGDKMLKKLGDPRHDCPQNLGNRLSFS